MDQLGALQLQRRQLGFGCPKLGLSLRDIQVAGDAAFAPVEGQFQRVAIGFGSSRQQVAFGIQRAEREVIGRDFGINGQFDRFQVIGAGIQLRPSGLDLASHAAQRSASQPA